MNRLFHYWLKGYVSLEEVINYLDNELGYFPGEINKIINGWKVAAKYIKEI